MARPAQDPPIARQTLETLCTTLSDRQIAHQFGVTHSGVGYWRKKYGIVRPSSLDGRWRRYELDETFFDVIDTEEKAYILGLIVSDGCIDTRSHALVIQLKALDVELLEQIRLILHSNRPLLYVAKPPGFAGSPQYRLDINSQHLYRALFALGITPRKSLTTSYPPIPAHLDRHFCRGLMDGDGWIGTRQACLLGSQELLLAVGERLLKHLDLAVHIKAFGSIWRLDIGRRTGAALRWMYQDATLYLSRKYVVVKEHWS
jgi:hypothetical protein